ncbi:MAG: CapA family protein [Lachnospiraceae bacterium]|nr:CapA family protein [Lachnospiraceae bacterium]
MEDDKRPGRPGAPRRPGTQGTRNGAPARRQLTPEERKRRQLIALRKQREKRKRMIMTACIIAVVVLILVGVIISVAGNKKDKKGSSGSDSTTKVASESGSSSKKSSESSSSSDVTNTPVPTSTPTPTPTPAPVSATIVAVGDDLMHMGVYNSGKQANGTYNFDHIFKDTAYLLEDADIKIMNQETIFAGNEKGLSSYPLFNSPVEMTDALVKAGYNVITHATNHARDMGIDGLLYSVRYWKEHHPETLVVGIYETAEEQKEIPIMIVNGIKFAILNYTYSHNSAVWKKDCDGHLNMLCAFNPDTREIDFNTINPQVLEDIKRAETLADFTIVCPHWGQEYYDTQRPSQETFAKQMTEAGADLIIGTHPHVIEPVAWIEADNGNKSLCYYSLGNFTSTQDEWVRILGGMAKLTVIKDGSGTYIDPESARAIPLVNHYTSPGNLVKGVYSLKNYTADLAAKHGLKPRKGIVVTIDNLTNHAKKIFGDFCSIE